MTDSESACDKLAFTHPSLKLRLTQAGSEAPDQAVTVSMAEWHGTRLLSDSESDPVQVRFPDRARLRAKGTWGPWPVFRFSTEHPLETLQLAPLGNTSTNTRAPEGNFL